MEAMKSALTAEAAIPVPAKQGILTVRNLSKRYGDLVAVNSVSFSVGKGEIFGILGPNGAGKTSTLEMIETLRGIGGG
jgi:ABC-2 type transport system ATP-binding protein